MSDSTFSAGPADAISSGSQGGPSVEGEGVLVSKEDEIHSNLIQVEKTLRDLIMNLRRRSGLRTALNFQGKAVRLQKRTIKTNAGPAIIQSFLGAGQVVAWT